jgi:hypothetical protein
MSVTRSSKTNPATDPRFWETCAELRQILHQLGSTLGPSAKSALARIAELHQHVEQDAARRSTGE